VVALVIVINEPRQAAVGPPMADTVGALLTVTVTTADALQPALLVTVYDIKVAPTATLLTTPVLLTVAMVLLAVLHTPPVVVSTKVMLLPKHTRVLPVIADTVGNAFTVKVVVAVLVQPAVLV